MSVGRLCTREVHTAEPTESIVAVARRMRERRVGTLVVVDAERRPVGIVTDRDLVVRGLAGALPAASLQVQGVMTSPMSTVPEETPIEDALARMRSTHHRRLGVVDAEGRLAGIFALDDALALLGDEFYRVGDLAANVHGR